MEDDDGQEAGGGISLLISPLNIFLSFSQFPYFFLSTYLGIFCGWMPEFEDKAIKLLRNAEPTTITPTLMLSKLKIYLSKLFFQNI